MNRKLYLLAALTLGVIAGGCSDDTYGLEGEGTINLRASIDSDVKVVSRADVTAEYADNCVIWISSSKGLVRKYNGIGELPTDGIRLLSGHYVAEAWAGDSVSASFDKKFFKGYTTFDVTGGTTAQVDLRCTIANVLASVNYQAEVDEVLKDYTLTVGHTKGELTLEERDARKAYFMMPKGVTTLDYTLKGVKTDGSPYTLSGHIDNVKPATEYQLNVKCNVDNATIGGAFITVEVDELEVVVEDEIVIARAPIVKSAQVDVTQPVMAESGAIGTQTLWVLGATTLKSVVLESALLNDGTHLSLGTDKVELIDASAETLAALAAGGVKVTYPWRGADATKARIVLEGTLLNSLPNGEYSFNIKAADADGRESQTAVKFIISDAMTAPLPVLTDGVDYSARSFTLRGKVLKEGVNTVGFRYRVKGSSSWTDVDAAPVSRSMAVGSEFTAYISGLTPGTTYEYCTTYNGEVSMALSEVTTEPATQLPNSGFEDWQTTKAPYLIYPEGGSMFWDSGNHGSATMRKNVTVPDGDIKHSGNYSIKLASQFVGVGTIGKFAAGNVFVGEYLATDGTDGVLGFGRPFTGRPVALKGYVKYKPVAINYADSDAPADCKVGNMDRGIVYIALLDGTTDGEYPAYPVVIKTKTKQLFDKNGANVIAYGELLFDATQGEGMVEFTVPLTYRRTDIRPSFIMCTASASKGGDYFAGGSGSNMWLDDLELVY